MKNMLDKVEVKEKSQIDKVFKRHIFMCSTVALYSIPPSSHYLTPIINKKGID